MSNNQATDPLTTASSNGNKNRINQALYRSIWRWHFYAGIFCIPFVILLAITGAIYLFKPYYENWQESQYHGLSVTQEALLPNQQIAAALAEIPEGKLLNYRLPQAADEAIMISVQADQIWHVFVNPYTGEVVGKQASNDKLMNIVKTIHGELLLGNLGSHRIVFVVAAQQPWNRRGLVSAHTPGQPRFLARSACRYRHLDFFACVILIDHRPALGAGVGLGTKRSPLV
jgi:hypothetical protein